MSTKNTAIAKVNPFFVVPSDDEITETKDLSGVSPVMTSLKKHPEWGGDGSASPFKHTHGIIITYGELKEGKFPDEKTGEIKDYILMTALVYPLDRKPTPEDGQLIAVQSGDIMRRVGDAITEKSFPIRGKLRKSGRAWFMD